MNKESVHGDRRAEGHRGRGGGASGPVGLPGRRPRVETLSWCLRLSLCVRDFEILKTEFFFCKKWVIGVSCHQGGQCSRAPICSVTKSTDQIKFFLKLLFLVVLFAFQALVFQAPGLLLAILLVCFLNVFGSTELH